MKEDQAAEIPREELLANIPLFSRLDRKEFKKLARLCLPKRFAAGDFIVEEGSTGLGLFVLVSGSAEVTKGGGEHKVVLATIGAGDILGEMALVDDSPRSATAVATEVTETLLLTRGSFRELLSGDPEIAWCIVPTLADRIRELQARIIADGRFDAPVDRVSDETVAEDQEAAQGTAEVGDSEAGELGVELLRTNYAMAMSVIAGMSATVRAMESAAHTMAHETEIESDQGLQRAVRGFPRGMLSAAAAALKEVEKVPERMVSAYRRHRRR